MNHQNPASYCFSHCSFSYLLSAAKSILSDAFPKAYRISPLPFSGTKDSKKHPLVGPSPPHSQPLPQHMFCTIKTEQFINPAKFTYASQPPHCRSFCQTCDPDRCSCCHMSFFLFTWQTSAHSACFPEILATFSNFKFSSWT